MNKYLKAYEHLCPDDALCDVDPRRGAIIAEMKAVHRAKTEREAAAIIEWWDAWPNPQHRNANEFVRAAWKIMGSNLRDAHDETAPLLRSPG
ncbi:MAG: hypothetical protein ACD_23C00214G0001 [uncultured bacterium]|nr:MAG: hypothetical protein ACD_23C00214G0001 [uncultured bacterium]